MYRVKDQNSINFLNQKIDEIKKADTNETENKTIDKMVEDQRSKKLNSHDDGFKTTKSIRSARSGNINDFGGNSLPVKNKDNNSIWGETNKPEKMSEVTEKDFKIDINSLKPIELKIDNKNINNDVYVSQNKTSIASTPDVKHNYKTLKNNISIFDTADFEKLAKKTDGEKLSEKNKEKRSQKDESWKTNEGTISSKNLFNNFFDNMKDK